MKIRRIQLPFEGAPKINAPGVYGASPGKPFLWLIPTTGERPMRFSAEGLPRGLKLDTESGIVSGAAEAAGEYTVGLSARNRLGAAVAVTPRYITSRLPTARRLSASSISGKPTELSLIP